jgi:hypothetical protein
VLEGELRQLIILVRGVDGAVLYDGACVTAPAECVIFRFVLEITTDSGTTWIIKQVIIRFHLVQGALNAKQMFGFILDSIQRVGIDRRNVLATPRDRHSVNEKAQRLLAPLLPRNTDLPCTCHTISNTCHQIDIPFVSKYLKNFNHLLGKSSACALIFRDITSETAERYSIKWMSKAFQIIQHFRLWARLPDFYQRVRARGLSKKSVAKQLKLLTAPPKRKKLSLEMAVMFDVSPRMVKHLTFLEGDSFLAPFTSRRIQEITAFFGVIASVYTPTSPS